MYCPLPANVSTELKLTSDPQATGECRKVTSSSCRLVTGTNATPSVGQKNCQNVAGYIYLVLCSYCTAAQYSTVEILLVDVPKTFSPAMGNALPGVRPPGFAFLDRSHIEIEAKKGEGIATIINPKPRSPNGLKAQQSKSAKDPKPKKPKKPKIWIRRKLWIKNIKKKNCFQP